MAAEHERRYSESDLHDSNHDQPKFINTNNNKTLRKDLIDRAVNFLRNDGVRRTPLGQKKAFLVRKGLCESEINEALSRADRFSATDTGEGTSVISQNSRPVLPMVPPKSAVWRDYATTAVFLSGASYAVYKFVRGYILPHCFNVHDPEQQRVQRLQENVNDVQNGLKFLIDGVQQTLSVTRQQQETLNRFLGQLEEKHKKSESKERAIQELKCEITAIKRLLLSCDQFPSLPSTTHLPAWQLSSVSHQQLINGDHSNGHSNSEVNSEELCHQDDAVSCDNEQQCEKTTPV